MKSLFSVDSRASSWLRLYIDIHRWCFMLNAQRGYNNNANVLIMDVLKAGY